MLEVITMTRRTSAEILAHADELARRFETFEPINSEETDALDGLARAVVDASNAQKNIDLWVAHARTQKKTWAAIGDVLGVSGEAVRQKYGEGVQPPPAGARRGNVASVRKGDVRVVPGAASVAGRPKRGVQAKPGSVAARRIERS